MRASPVVLALLFSNGCIGGDSSTGDGGTDGGAGSTGSVTVEMHLTLHLTTTAGQNVSGHTVYFEGAVWDALLDDYNPGETFASSDVTRSLGLANFSRTQTLHPGDNWDVAYSLTTPAPISNSAEDRETDRMDFSTAAARASGGRYRWDLLHARYTTP